MQLATGHEFYTNTKCLLLITFAPGLEHIVNCYALGKMAMPIILGIQWL